MPPRAKMLALAMLGAVVGPLVAAPPRTPAVMAAAPEPAPTLATDAAPAGAMASTAPAASSSPAAPIDEWRRVDASVARGVAFLQAPSMRDHWEPRGLMRDASRAEPGGLQWGASTAMVMVALERAGCADQPPGALGRAVTYLSNRDMRGNVAMAWRARLWSSAWQSPDLRKRIETLAAEDAQRCFLASRRASASSDSAEPTPGDFDDDPLAIAFSLIGAADCTRVDSIDLAPDFWGLMDHQLRIRQTRDGSWPANDAGADAAPLTSLVTLDRTAVAAVALLTSDQFVPDRQGVGCVGNLYDPNLERALGWLGDHVDAAFDDAPSARGAMGLRNLGMYELEQVGLLTGRQYIGNADWSKRGVAALLAAQRADGSWGSSADTALAILFLKSARRQPLIHKLFYSIAADPDAGMTWKPGNWNQRPYDVANMLEDVSSRLNVPPLGWDLVDLELAPQRLNQAPLLYIGGDQTLRFTPAQMTRLRQFVQQGGLIVGNADCGSAIFAASFRALGARLFPRSAPMRVLPFTHRVWRWVNEDHRRQSRTRVEGLSNGSRELMLLLDHDPARYWETRSRGGHEDAFDLMLGVVAYATGGSVESAAVDYHVRADPHIKAAATLAIARIQYDGAWDPEPGGWERFAAQFHNSQQIDLSVEPVKLGADKLKFYKVAHLTGAAALSLNDTQVDELHRFVLGGGTLIIDACGGAEAFNASIQPLLPRIAGARSPLIPLLPRHPMLVLGDPLVGCCYRGFLLPQIDPGATLFPRLLTARLNGRTLIFYSPDDLSTGLVGTPVDGVRGYTPAVALNLMTKMLLYADMPK